MKSYRGFASGRDWSQKFNDREKRRYVFEDAGGSNAHQTLVEVVPLAAGAPAAPPVGSRVHDRGDHKRGTVLTNVYPGFAGWYVQVMWDCDTASRSHMVDGLTVIPETETIRVEITGPPADIAEIKQQLGRVNLLDLTYKVL